VIRIAAAAVVGLALGAVSRWIDTAAWAPGWIDYVFTPWLAAAWLAGALTVFTPRSGALAGAALLLAVVLAYLASAGASSLPVLPLYALAVVAGPIFGAAGATWRGRGPLAAWGGALLGVAFVVEGMALELVAHSTPERLLLAGESLVGIGLTTWLFRAKRPR